MQCHQQRHASLISTRELPAAQGGSASGPVEQRRNDAAHGKSKFWFTVQHVRHAAYRRAAGPVDQRRQGVLLLNLSHFEIQGMSGCLDL